MCENRYQRRWLIAYSFRGQIPNDKSSELSEVAPEFELAKPLSDDKLEKAKVGDDKTGPTV
jgi:hypothetical protein